MKEREKRALRRLLKIRLTLSFSGWVGWWRDNRRYPALRVVRRTNLCDVLLCLREGGPGPAGGGGPAGWLPGGEERTDRMAHLPRA